jgi:imidazolonepropionase-like amidohydrolase
MRAFQNEFPSVFSEEVLQMVTLNAARALRWENALGRIRSGFRADLISIPTSGEGDLFEEIVAFDGEIDWMMVNGKQQQH